VDSINDEEMKTADINKNLVDSYFLLLKDLSPDNKLELIARLSKSMKKEKMAKKKKENSLESLYGSWVSEQSADELVQELKNARNFFRKREEL